MDLILRKLFCCQYLFLRIKIPVIRSFFNTVPGSYIVGVRRIPNQTDSDVASVPDRAIEGKSQKRIGR